MSGPSDRMDRNVVLVTIDSLRADHCGYVLDATGRGVNHSNAPDGPLTPTLDVMADDGLAFTDAIAPGPKTPESMPAIATGHHQPRQPVGDAVGGWERIIRPQVGARETIAERFAEAGYTTIGFSPNGYSSSYFGFDAGFDHFEDFLDDDIRPDKRVPGPLRGLLKWVRREGNWKQWEGYYDDVLAALEATSEPYFLWVFLMDVHSPYLVPRSHRSSTWPEMVYANLRSEASPESDGIRRRVRRAYEDTVTYADDCLARLRADAPGDPVFCVHADHGEAFGEHGDFGHERLLYHENLAVPFVVSGVEVTGTVDDPVSLVELPSVLTSAAAGTLSDRLQSIERRRPVVAKSGEGGRIAVRFGSKKLIRSDENEELYDLSNDPDERTDLADDRPYVRDALGAVADHHAVTEREELRIRSRAGDVATDGL